MELEELQGLITNARTIRQKQDEAAAEAKANKVKKDQAATEAKIQVWLQTKLPLLINTCIKKKTSELHAKISVPFPRYGANYLKEMLEKLSLKGDRIYTEEKALHVSITL